MSGNKHSTGQKRANQSSSRRSNIETLVARLESEFNSSLEPAVTLKALTKKTGQLLRLMSFGDFCFIQGAVPDRFNRQQHKILISTLPQKEVDRAINYLYDAALGQVNRDLSKISYEETDSLVDPSKSGIKRGCYILFTRTGNYAFFLRKAAKSLKAQQVLCIVGREDSENFKDQVERNLLAIDSINRVVEKIGLEKFPGIFDSQNEINLDSKPIRLLNMIAQDDFTINQAARMLNMPVDTANKYIARVKSELGVSTLPSAVFYAASKGLIDRPG